MKIQLTILLLFALSESIAARTLYFSSVSGDDVSGSGTFAAPYKSLSKLNNIFYSLVPGDSVLLKRGETFFGTITINKGGTKARPIVIGAYGTGAKPTITSRITPIWTGIGSNKYESQTLTGSSNVQVVELNFVPQRLARWPNYDAANGGWKTVDSHTWSGTATTIRTGSITDAELSGAPSVSSWPGVEIINRTRRWVLARDVITGKSSNTINFESTNDYAPQDGWGYFFQGSSAFLDQDYEWVYNATTGKATMYHTGSSPAGIQISTRDTLIKNTSSSYDNIVIRDIEVAGSNKYGIWMRGDTCKLINVDVKSTALRGVVLGGNASTADSCTWDYNLNEALFLETTGRNRKIRYCSFNHTGNYPGMGQTDYAYNAIEKRGYGDSVMYCTIKNTGGCAIREGNYNYQLSYAVWADSSNLVKHDNGAIYMFGRPNDDASGNPVYNVGRKIENCIVTNTIGAPYGTMDPIVFPCHLANAIYLDNETSGVSVLNCTIVGSERGLFVNTRCRNNYLRGNTIFNGDVYQFYINTGATPEETMGTSNRLTNNIFFAKQLLQRTTYYQFSSGSYALQSFGVIDSNYYVRPIDTTNGMIKDNVPLVTLNEFRSNHPLLEPHGKPSPLKVTDVNNLRIEYNATTSSSTFSLGGTYKDVFGTSHTSATLDPYESIALIRTGSANAAPTVSLTSPSDGSTSTAPATVSIAATASDADGTITQVDFYNGSTLLGSDASSPYTYTWNSVGVGGYNLTAKATDNTGAVTTSSSISITVTAANTPPVVAITTPAADTTLIDTDSLYVIATASDAGGAITHVDLWVDGVFTNRANTSLYDYTRRNVLPGIHVLTAIAYDNAGDSTISAPIIANFTQSSPAFQIELAATDTILCNGDQITIGVGAIGGVPPYGGDVGNHTVSAGTYEYIVTDSDGGADTASIVVYEPPAALSASADVGTITVYQGSTTATINVTGGTSPYQLSIDGLAYTTNNVFTVFAGNHTVNVTDANGCTTSTSFSLSQPAADCNCIPRKHGRKKVLL